MNIKILFVILFINMIFSTPIVNAVKIYGPPIEQIPQSYNSESEMKKPIIENTNLNPELKQNIISEENQASGLIDSCTDKISKS
ncbi:MAG: hypothetical protein ACOC5R_01425 [Elusimicrobiota bacterium]